VCRSKDVNVSNADRKLTRACCFFCSAVSSMFDIPDLELDCSRFKRGSSPVAARIEAPRIMLGRSITSII
jgi:hypothetical protein